MRKSAFTHNSDRTISAKTKADLTPQSPIANLLSPSAYRDDFVRWCSECVYITDKLTGLPVPFRLNAPQRRLVEVLERQRLLRRPIRVILLKARQWGGSTLVQAYMAWMQLVRHAGWNSLVCAHRRDAAASIRGIYSLLLQSYPAHLKEGDARDWTLRPYQQTAGTLQIPARGCCISLATAGSPDALRGTCFHLAHLSEAAFWGDGDPAAASAIVRTVCSAIPSVPESLIVIESTADGPDNYFAQEWQRAVRGESDKEPVFVPWHEIEIYRRPLTDAQRATLPSLLDNYELDLLHRGVPPEAVAWYHDKRREYTHHAEMMAEFPSTPEEAFATSESALFSEEMLAHLCDSDDDDLPPAPALAVFAPSSTHACGIALYGYRHGRMYQLRAMTEHGSLHAALERAMELCRESGVPLAVVEAENPDDTPHGMWCLRRARRCGISLHYSTGSPLLTRSLLPEMIDVYTHLLLQGAVRDHSQDSLQRHRAFRRRRADKSPLILTNLAAAYLLEPRLESEPLHPEEFYADDRVEQEEYGRAYISFDYF